jgi:hypothetical protein
VTFERTNVNTLRTIGGGFFQSVLIAFFTIASFANLSHALAAQVVDDYVNKNGGCHVLAGSWEKEFNQPDRMPFGKSLLDWQPEDYAAVRLWVEKCLDPWIAVPGRREFFMQGVDHRIEIYRQIQQEQISAKLKREEKAAQLQNRQKKIQELTSKYHDQLIAISPVKDHFEKDAEPFLKIFNSLQISEVEGVVSLGENVNQLKVQADALIAAARSTGDESARLGAPLPPVPTLLNGDLVASRLQKLYKIRAELLKCGPILAEAGVPQMLIGAKMAIGSSDDDWYLFELICPRDKSLVRFTENAWFSKFYRFDVGTKVSSLWFDFRDDDGTGTWSQPVATHPTVRARLLLKRFKSGSTDATADSYWGSVNLLNCALVVLLLNQYQ